MKWNQNLYPKQWFDYEEWQNENEKPPSDRLFQKAVR